MTDSTRRRLLLVEDEALIAMSEKIQLEEYGYTVQTVTTGEKAVEVFDTSLSIDLVLMDINLGDGIDGTQAAEIILKSHDIPIVFLSSHTEPEIVEKTEKITSYGYVVKNSTITVLDASIKMAFKLFDAKKAHVLKEIALQESETRFHELFERAPLGYQSLDSDGRFLEVNQAWLETLGYSYDDVIGEWFGDFLAPEYVQAFTERFSLFKAQGHIHSEFHMLHRNGNRVYVAFDGRVGYNHDGSFRQTHCILRDETDRRQTDEELKRFKAVADNALYGKAIADLNGNLLYTNRFFAAIHGYEPEKLVGKHFSMLHGEPQMDAVNALIATMIREGTFAPTTVWHRHRNGTVFPMLMSGILLKDDYGNPQYIAATSIDISDRIIAEETLQKEKVFLKAVIDSIPVMITRFDPTIDVLGVNREFERVIGWKDEELKDINLMEEVYPDPAYRRIAHEYMERAVVEWREFSLRARSGATVISEWSNICLDNGTRIGIGIDVTERKQVERALSQKSQLLEQTQVLANLGSWEWDIVRDTWHFSEQWKTIHGVSDTAFDTSALMQIAHPEDAGYIEKAILHAKEHDEFYDIEHRIIRADSGEVRYIKALGRVEHDPDTGRPVRMVGSAQDITDRKHAEQEIQRQLAEKELLLREVNHRVKNHIGIIESLLSVQADSIEDVEVKAALQDSISRVQSMRVLYEKILLSESVHDVSIKDYAESLIDSLSTAYDFEDKVTIERDIADFRVDTKVATSIGIILNELLTNVFKYAFKNRDHGLVSVSIAKQDGSVTLIIKDDGAGFDARALENKSPGLGLTLVRMLTEQLGGTYSVSNDSGAMSVLRFAV